MRKLIAYPLGWDSHPLLIDKVRRLYNEAIPMLSTKPLTSKTPTQQTEWWNNLDWTKVKLHVYSLASCPWQIVAFSMVTDRGSHCTPMFAIDPAHWGKGLGEEIIEHYLALAYPKPLIGEQLSANGAICHLNEKHGWKVEYEYMGVQHLKHDNVRTLPLQETCDRFMEYNEGG